MDGHPKASATRVDVLEQTPEDDRAKNASFVRMECQEQRNNPRSHADVLTANEIMQSQLMKQMQYLCDTVKDMGQNGREVCRRRPKKEGKKSAPDNRNTKRESVSEDGNAYSNG